MIFTPALRASVSNVGVRAEASPLRGCARLAAKSSVAFHSGLNDELMMSTNTSV